MAPSSPPAPSPQPRPELPDGLEPTPAPAPPPGPLAPVPAWAPFAGLVGVFAIASIATVIILTIVEATGRRVVAKEIPQGVLLGGSLIQDIALVLTAFALARIWVRPTRPSLLGVRATPWLQALGWAALVYGCFWVFSGLYSAALGPQAEQRLVEDLKSEDSLLVLGGFAVLVGVFAPIAEEVFFRGLLFGTLRDKMGPVPAIVIAGSVFGLVHASGTPLRALPVLLVLGIGFCVLYHKTGSIVPGMALHALHNSITFAVTTTPAAWVYVPLVLGSVGAVLLVATGVRTLERRLA